MTSVCLRVSNNYKQQEQNELRILIQGPSAQLRTSQLERFYKNLFVIIFKMENAIPPHSMEGG